MEEKYNAIWFEVEQDGAARVIYEIYLVESDKLHIVYVQKNGSYVPYSFVKKRDSQWRLPVWCKENEKALLPSLESAKEYLINFR